MLPGGRAPERQALTDERCLELGSVLRSSAPSTSAAVEELEARNATGRTAFLTACSIGDTERTKLLVDAGCDTAAVDNDGANALMLAALSGVGAAGAVREALAAGWCELEATNTYGNTVFLMVCYEGDTECMQLLAEAGCDTAAVNNKGVNALMRASFSGVGAAVRTVLAAGWCELETRQETGDTAFLVACMKGSIECMQLLVDAGCNTATKSNDGGTALMHTAFSGVAAAVRAALAAGWC